jgi:hypothetical protein
MTCQQYYYLYMYILSQHIERVIVKLKYAICCVQLFSPKFSGFEVSCIIILMLMILVSALFCSVQQRKGVYYNCIQVFFFSIWYLGVQMSGWVGMVSCTC